MGNFPRGGLLPALGRLPSRVSQKRLSYLCTGSSLTVMFEVLCATLEAGYCFLASPAKERI